MWLKPMRNRIHHGHSDDFVGMQCRQWNGQFLVEQKPSHRLSCELNPIWSNLLLGHQWIPCHQGMEKQTAY
jgi:hypothetical protein